MASSQQLLPCTNVEVVGAQSGYKEYRQLAGSNTHGNVASSLMLLQIQNICAGALARTLAQAAIHPLDTVGG